jgi:hypothetical protein
MGLEEFEAANTQTLKAEAKACYDGAMEMAGGAWERRVAKLLEAQFYMSEIDRRQAEMERQEDRRIASRSHRMELIIIGMIGLEIIIALVAIWLGFKEGKEQAVILERIEKAAMRAGNMNIVR